MVEKEALKMGGTGLSQGKSRGPTSDFSNLYDYYLCIYMKKLDLA
jgi:hypothetical protein